jgi:Carboxypeptidase regulatory-like domain
MMPSMKAIVMAAACACLVPTATWAQAVRGTVREEGTGIPIEGAMVIVLETDGAPVRRVLTDAAGAFTVRVGHPGLYSIRVDRIGYASLTTNAFEVPVTGTSREIDVPIEAVALSGLDVEGEPRCEVRPEEGRVVARLWAEARKALEATTWTQETGLYGYTLLSYTRNLDRDGREILDERRSFTRSSGESPFESAPIEELVERGFVQETSDSASTFYAPDAAAFLSDAFLDTHCFGARVGPDSTIGVTFEPVEGRELPEIRGVLWLDRTTAELDRLVFDYINLPRALRTGERGGEIRFTRLPNGSWIVQDWWIRMPLVRYARLGRTRRIGYRDEGGVTWRVVDRSSGTIILEAGTATVSGRVLDSLSATPVSDVTVRVPGVGGIRPRADGSFLVPGLAEGLQSLSVGHALLDTLGLPAPEVRVTATAGMMTQVDLRVPRLAEALVAACGGAPRPERTAPLLGRVVGRDRRPRAGVRVRLAWWKNPAYVAPPLAAPSGPQGEPEISWVEGSSDGYATVDMETDARGIFLLCDVPTSSRIRATVRSRDGSEVTRRPIVPLGAKMAFVRIRIEGGEAW